MRNLGRIHLENRWRADLDKHHEEERESQFSAMNEVAGDDGEFRSSQKDLGKNW